ncbi:hypothetical protein ABW21_db0200707 [Orbilia brochopaga]|nr:hypothetical protein ABW21_db0200707 [Drechslerella brochopaga]
MWTPVGAQPCAFTRQPKSKRERRPIIERQTRKFTSDLISIQIPRNGTNNSPNSPLRRYLSDPSNERGERAIAKPRATRLDESKSTCSSETKLAAA